MAEAGRFLWRCFFGFKLRAPAANFALNGHYSQPKSFRMHLFLVEKLVKKRPFNEKYAARPFYTPEARCLGQDRRGRVLPAPSHPLRHCSHRADPQTHCRGAPSRSLSRGSAAHFNAKFIVLNAKSIVCNTKSMIFSHQARGGHLTRFSGCLAALDHHRFCKGRV